MPARRMWQRPSARDLVGVEQVKRDLKPGTGSEDFSFMLEEVPGCYLLIGNSRRASIPARCTIRATTSMTRR